MIDIKQFEGHTEGPWKAYATDEGFVAVFPSKLLIKGKQDCIAVLSTIGNPSLSDLANRNLVSSAPELLEEVIALREKLSIRNHIETINSLQCCANCESYSFKWEESSFCHFMDCDVDPTTVCGDWSNEKNTK